MFLSENTLAIAFMKQNEKRNFIFLYSVGMSWFIELTKFWGAKGDI